MSEYIEFESKKRITITKLKNFEFPSSGAKILFKARPPVAKEVSTD
ncbi:hypothetical protein KAW38_01625 [Candidatus Micrarchaeota archaeon]|nr:hypothetical protein [Candidatus Micrarchaeota archaeon]